MVPNRDGWRHVADSAHYQSRLGCTTGLAGANRLRKLCQPEVENLDLPVFCHKHVFRLQITMGDALGMRNCQTARHLLVSRISSGEKRTRLFVLPGNATPEALVLPLVASARPMRDNNVLSRHIKPAARKLASGFVNWQARCCKTQQEIVEQLTGHWLSSSGAARAPPCVRQPSPACSCRSASSFSVVCLRFSAHGCQCDVGDELYYRKLAQRLRGDVAVFATARKLATLIYWLLRFT